MKLLIIELLTKLAKKEPELTFGETLYTILRPKYIGKESNLEKIGWLRNVKDNDFFTALERALKEAE